MKSCCIRYCLFHIRSEILKGVLQRGESSFRIFFHPTQRFVDVNPWEPEIGKNRLIKIWSVCLPFFLSILCLSACLSSCTEIKRQTACTSICHSAWPYNCIYTHLFFHTFYIQPYAYPPPLGSLLISSVTVTNNPLIMPIPHSPHLFQQFPVLHLTQFACVIFYYLSPMGSPFLLSLSAWSDNLHTYHPFTLPPFSGTRSTPTGFVSFLYPF